MLLLGIDVGTTGAKATVFDEDGNQCGYGFEEYGIDCPGQGRAEQDAELVWQITKRVIAQATHESGPSIRALSVSVQGDAVVPIDSGRRALAPVQLGMDYRGAQESIFCAAHFGARRLFDLTGMRPHPLNALIKILWIKEHDPELYDRTWKFVTYADFILAKLGSDEIVIDYSMASRTMAFDLHTQKWSGEVLSSLGISADKLGKPVPSSIIVGNIPADLAEELGLNPRTLIVTGGHDQACAALGAGIIKENMALDSHGTAEVVSTPFMRPHQNDVMFNSYYPCYSHVVPGMYFTFSLNHIGGILLKWFAEGFCYEDALAAQQTNIRFYELLLQKAPDGPAPVMVLPYFNGSGTPTCDLSAKGAILGLTLDTTRYDIAKAIVEALSFEMRVNIETLRSAGININQLRCVGGGARSPIGLQNKADITGLPISTLKIRESACLGAAMLAGMASGVYRNAEEASNIVVLADTYHPRSEISRLYDSGYSTYAALYDTLKLISNRF